MKTGQSKNATLSPVATGSSALAVPDGDIGTGCLPGIGAKPVPANPKRALQGLFHFLSPGTVRMQTIYWPSRHTGVGLRTDHLIRFTF